MSILTTLYWVILVIAFLLGVAPASPSRPWQGRAGDVAWTVLFVLIGLKLFHTPLN